MGRRSVIASHPQRDKIEADILNGVPGNEIARRYGGVSESSISRWRGLQFDALRQLADDSQPAPDDLLVRLADLADSTTKARKFADVTGNPATRARAQANELAALSTLIDRTGVTDLTAVNIARATGALVRATQTYVRENPAHAPALFEIFGRDADLIELRDALKAEIRKTS